MRVDTHVHFLSYNCFESLETYRKESGVEKIFLLSTPNPMNPSIGNPNEEVSKVLDKDSSHYIGLGAFDYSSKKCLDRQVISLKQRGFRGIKMLEGKPNIQQAFGRSITDSLYKDAMNQLEKENMFALIHIADPPVFWSKEYGQYNVGYPNYEFYINQMEAFLSLYPNLKCIFAHLAFLARGLKDLTRIMREHPNLMLDTTPGRWFYRPLVEQKAQAIKFFEEFHDRIVTGTDAMFTSANEKGLLASKSISECLDICKTVDTFLFTENKFHDTFPYKEKRKDLELTGLGMRHLEKEIAGDNALKLIGENI